MLAIRWPSSVALKAVHSASVGQVGSPGRSLHFAWLVEEEWVLVPKARRWDISVVWVDCCWSWARRDGVRWAFS